MESFVKKVLVGFLLIMVCSFIMSYESSAMPGKNNPREGPECEMTTMQKDTTHKGKKTTSKSEKRKSKKKHHHKDLQAKVDKSIPETSSGDDLNVLQENIEPAVSTDNVHTNAAVTSDDAKRKTEDLDSNDDTSLEDISASDSATRDSTITSDNSACGKSETEKSTSESRTVTPNTDQPSCSESDFADKTPDNEGAGNEDMNMNADDDSTKDKKDGDTQLRLPITLYDSSRAVKVGDEKKRASLPCGYLRIVVSSDGDISPADETGSPVFLDLNSDALKSLTTTTTTTTTSRGRPLVEEGRERSFSKLERGERSKIYDTAHKRKSSLLFSTLQLNIPGNILRDAEGVIENPIKRKDVKLSVEAPTVVSTTPGLFGIKVSIDDQLECEIDDVSIYVQFEDDSTELSFAPPVPVVKDIKLVDTDQYLYNVQVGRVDANVNRGFIVYATHKALDKSGEKREYLIAAHKQQVFLKASPPNKAVIIVPGICGSELFSAKAQVIDGVQYSKGYRIWPPEGVATVMEDGIPCCTSARTKSKFVQRLMQDVSLISCTDNGKSKARVMVSNPIMDCKANPDRRNFGTINCYGDLVSSILQSNYAKDSKVIFFSYDWRIGNKKVADSLKKFIVKNDLTDVILVAHSMGGLVCSSLLTSTSICPKISKVIFLGTPFLGAAKAYNVLENGMFFDGIIGDVTGPVANPAISMLAKNWKSVYELLPPKQLFDIMRGPSCRSDVLDRGYLYTRKSKSNPLTSNYVLRDNVETAVIIQSRNWTPNVNDFLRNAQTFHDSLYTADGEMKFLRNRVPIYNVVGMNTETHSGYFLTYDRKNRVSCKEDLDNGDGTVTLISSTLFGNIPDKNTYYVKGVNHMGLMQHAKCLQLINNIIDGHEERFDPTIIIKRYPSGMDWETCGCCFPLCLC